MSVRVVQYNILAPKLCTEEGDFEKSVGHCDVEIRWERLKSKLAPEMEQRSVIALQEVGRDWGGRFHTFFNANNYRFVYQGHGNAFSDYMGQAIAFHESFELLDCKFLSPFNAESTNFESVSAPQPITNGYLPACILSAGALAASFFFQTHSVNIAKATLSTFLLSSLYLHFQAKKPALSPYDISMDIRYSVSARERDVIVAVKLKLEDSAFWVTSNHMPCKYRNPPLMAVYTGFTAKAVQTVAKDDPYIIAGDFNQDPFADSYKILTQGSKAEISLDVAKYLPETEPMRSAYAEGAGKEPEYTNFCDRLYFGYFKGTLDFIFLSKHWKVESVKPVPEIDAESWPSEKEPSDHCMLVAHLTLQRD